MTAFNWQSELARDGSRVFVAGLPVAMHCHHYNINLQKTLEDTLGDEGIQLLFHSAEEANRIGFTSFFNEYRQLKTNKSKLEMAAVIYQNSGFGIIHLQGVNRRGGTILSPSSHHVTGWLAKHGLRDTPGCHFTRGWIAGVLEAVFDKPAGHYTIEETHCKMMRDKECVFQVTGV